MPRSLIHDEPAVRSRKSIMGCRGNPCDDDKAESFMQNLEVEAVTPMALETFEDGAEPPPRFIG